MLLVVLPYAPRRWIIRPPTMIDSQTCPCPCPCPCPGRAGWIPLYDQSMYQDMQVFLVNSI